ncbi:TraA family conjugative transfer protein [Burkholderia gladioli]|uniref:TraA family conjugative transfer protein n=1 Tax=Burkholderia gladioli TaxID=28095 RepID=UPI0021522933|nr:TraA family conjugative transfer protein [Burkholderia gladioli]
MTIMTLLQAAASSATTFEQQLTRLPGDLLKSLFRRAGLERQYTVAESVVRGVARTLAGLRRDILNALVFIAILLPFAAFAGTDTTFNSVVTMVSGWLTGSLGQTLALSGFGVALGSGLIRGSIMGVVSGLALALAATYGPTVLTGLFTATF